MDCHHTMASPCGAFPQRRLRRLRTHPWLRDLVAQTTLSVKDLVLPLFVRTEKQDSNPTGLPEFKRHTLTELTLAVQTARDAGIPSVLLFPANDDDVKTDDGREAYNPNNIVCQAIRQLKHDVPDIGLWADVALDPYTTHGHDGVLINGRIANDASLAALSKQALVLANAGADVIAPSDMMDGNVQSLRHILDTHNHEEVLIVSYAAKFASSFYGPFRQAVGAAALKGLANKQTYQIDMRTNQQFYNEVAMDIAEGADMIIIKPGLAYLDVLARVSDRVDIPVLSYQVSGEYMMLHHTGAPFQEILLETLYSFKRAGANAIITYGALEASRLLR